MLHGAASFGTLADFPFEVKGMNALAAQQFALIERTAAEVGKVLRLRAVPTYFSNGQHARVKHILSMFRRRHIFCPEISLHAAHAFQFFGIEIFEGIERIDVFQRQISADGFGLRRGRVLVTVEVAEVARGKDYAVA